MGGCCGKTVEVTEESSSRQQQEDSTGGLADAYHIKHLLGSGCAGDTWLCVDKQTNEVVAVKLMKRPIPAMMGSSIIREVKIGAALGKGHLNIVKPRELILTRTHLGLVMEYVAGGNMADYILKTILLKFGGFDTRDGLVMEEDEARYYFSQIVNAMQYCHDNRVAHRDLKMDNTLLDDHNPPRIKLCDFGFARSWSDLPQMSTITGTPDYMSPQLLGPKAQNKKALYDATKADIWASGVLLCVMLIGRFPFEGTEMNNATNLDDVSAHVWRQQTSRGKWYDNPLIQNDCLLLSNEVIDLLSLIFELDEDRRITLDGIKAHPWYTKPLPELYQRAMDKMDQEQELVNQQVKSGVFKSRDRDSALKHMIYLAATRYDPSQELQLQPDAEGTGDEVGRGSAVAAALRKISLSSINPMQYSVPLLPTADLAAISDMFLEAAPPGEGGVASPSSTEHGGSGAAAALAAATDEPATAVAGSGGGGSPGAAAGGDTGGALLAGSRVAESPGGATGGVGSASGDVVAAPPAAPAASAAHSPSSGLSDAVQARAAVAAPPLALPVEVEAAS